MSHTHHSAGRCQLRKAPEESNERAAVVRVFSVEVWRIPRQVNQTRSSGRDRTDCQRPQRSLAKSRGGDKDALGPRPSWLLVAGPSLSAAPKTRSLLSVDRRTEHGAHRGYVLGLPVRFSTNRSRDQSRRVGQTGHGGAAHSLTAIELRTHGGHRIEMLRRGLASC